MSWVSKNAHVLIGVGIAVVVAAVGIYIVGARVSLVKKMEKLVALFSFPNHLIPPLILPFSLGWWRRKEAHSCCCYKSSSSNSIIFIICLFQDYDNKHLTFCVQDCRRRIHKGDSSWDLEYHDWKVRWAQGGSRSSQGWTWEGRKAARWDERTASGESTGNQIDRYLSIYCWQQIDNCQSIVDKFLTFFLLLILTFFMT